MTTLERWNVVDCDGNYVFGPYYTQENAQEEADFLNERGLEEFRPYKAQRIEIPIDG